MSRLTRRSVITGAIAFAASFGLPAMSRGAVAQTSTRKTASREFELYDYEVSWSTDAFRLFNAYASESDRLDMIALEPIGSRYEGGLGFWLGETEFNGFEEVSDYLESDELLNYLDGTEIIRAHFDTKKGSAGLLFLPKWQGKVDAYGYWEFRKIGEAPNEWARIVLDGTLSAFDADTLEKRLKTVMFDDDPPFTVTSIPDLVELIADLKDEYL